MSQSITPAELQSLLTSNSDLKLIDVRTPGEFQNIHAVGAIHLPLDQFDAAEVIRSQKLTDQQPVYMICKMGGRSQKACDLLKKAGLTNVVNVTGGTDRWVAGGLPSVRGEKQTFAIHRQVQLLAGSLAFTGALLSFVNPWWALLSAFIGGGLMFSGLTDTCGMGAVLGKMPWNQASS